MDPPARVGDRFEIEREAGSGGMGTVYRGRDAVTGGAVAIKILHAGADRERFEREARVLAELEHPGIVRYVAHGMEDSGPFLVMDWVQGEDLEQRIGRRGLSVAESVRLVRRVAEALGAAHARGIVHRDLKPSNVLLEGGDLERPRVIDFGVARAGPGGDRRTRTGIAVGTPAYMAPEQARGERDIDARADVFSLGCVLFECCTGRPPFAGDHVMAILAKVLLEDAPRLSETMPEVSTGLDDLVARMLAKEAAERPRDGRAVAGELESLGESLPHERRSAPSERPSSLTGGEQRLVSVVVLDGSVEPEGKTMMVDHATSALDRMTEVVRSFEARVEMMIDGSVVLLLPAGGTASDQASRAAACALALRAAVDTPIALATGRAEVTSRLPVGDAIDRAVELLRTGAEGLGGAVRLDAVTSGLLDDRFEQGRDALGRALFGRRESEAPRVLLGRSTPFVGREAELSILDGLFSQCVGEPMARAVLVTGEAGVGKSRLLRELLQRIRTRGDPVEVWMARGDPVGGSPFGMASQLVRRAAAVLEGEPVEVTRDKIQRRVARRVPQADRERVAEFLGAMVGVPADPSGAKAEATRRDPLVMGDQIRRAFEDFVSAECAEGPLLVVLEGLQWGDRTTGSLVDSALRLSAEKPLFVLGLARPELDELFPDLFRDRDVQRLRLAGLPRRASERLVRAALGERARPELVERLVRQAAGNPFYLEEFIRSASDEGCDNLPETVLAMVQARLDAVDPAARRLLRAASVFGQVFWERAAVSLLGKAMRAEDARFWLDDLVRRELVEPRSSSRFAGEVEYVFRQGLLREAAYAMLTDADRALGHRLAAAWLAGAGETDADAFALHFERGGELGSARRFYARAAEQGIEGNDYAGAVERVERAVVAGASGEELAALRRLQAEAHRLSGQMAEADRRAQEALSISPFGSELWALSASEVARAGVALGRVDRVAELGEKIGDALAAGHRNTACLVAAAGAATTLYQGGRTTLADALLGAVVAEWARLASDPKARAGVERARAVHALHNGDLVGFLGWSLAVVASLAEAGDVRGGCSALGNAGYGYMELGAYAEAERLLVEALASAERMGLRQAIATAKHNLGWVYYGLGRLDEARRTEQEATEICRANGSRRLEGGSRAYLACILLELGDLGGAEHEANLAAKLLETAPPLRASALAALALILVAKGSGDEARLAAQEAMDALEALGHVEAGEALIRLAYAEALEAAGDREAALHAIAVARRNLLIRAGAIGDPGRRQSFLATIPEHGRTMTRAAEWLGS